MRRRRVARCSGRRAAHHARPTGIPTGSQDEAPAKMGLSGEDRFWPGLGLLADILSYTGGAYGNRDRIPGY